MNRSLACAFSSLGALCTALVLAACSGKDASPTQSSSAAAQTVAASEVSGPVVACGVGQAHPNVCCEAGPSTSTACIVHPGAPFAACSAGTTTFPDPRSCCALDGSGACVAPPATPPQPIPVDPWCRYPCPVGEFQPSGGPGGVCCATTSTGETICHGGGPATGDAGIAPPATGGEVGSAGGSAGGSSSGGSTGSSSGPSTGSSSGGPSTGSSSGGPSTGSSSGGIGCACPLVCEQGGPCPPPCVCPPPAVCGTCPPGWQHPEGDPRLCCTEASDGVIECFSQGYPPPPPPLDGGVTPPPQDASVICDPNGPPPRNGCTWDLKTCAWACPVCDPPPPPDPSCKWDSTDCEWLCLASGN